MSMKGVLQLLLCVVVSVKTSEAEGSWNNIQKLRQDLLKKYDKGAMPHKFANGTTTVHLWMRLRDYFFDDKTQTLTIHSWMTMTWMDERLKWDYKDYGELRKTHFSSDELWKPDISVFNNYEVTKFHVFGDVQFLVLASGEVYWFPPSSMKVKCPLILRLWPFDQHTCEIIMGSWTADGNLINFQFLANQNGTEIDTNGLLEHNDKNTWLLMKAERRRYVFHYGGDEIYLSLEFLFSLKRNSPTFNAIVVVPAVVIPLFLLVQFFLPVEHPQRLSIAFTCAFLVILELMFLKYNLPDVGGDVPLIMTYYSECFVIVFLSAALSTILSRLSHPQNPLLAFPPPEILKRLLTGPLALVLCLTEHAKKVGLSGKVDEEGEILETSKVPNYSHEWLLVAKSIDRVALFVLVCVFIFSLIAYVSPVK